MTDIFHRDPIADSPISVVLLAYNAEQFVTSVLKKWRKTLDSLEREYEIIVVDDGSSDETTVKVEEFVTKNPNVRILKHDKHQGVGTTLKTGLAEARHPLVCYCPCDEAYVTKDLKTLLQDIDQVDVVVGQRQVHPIPQWLLVLGIFYRIFVRVILYWTSRPREVWLGWNGYWRSWWAWWFFGQTLEDVGSPFRLYRKDAVDKLPIQSTGDFVHIELLAKGTFRTQLVSIKPIKYKLLDKPVPDFQRPYTWSDFLKVLNKPRFVPPVSLKETHAQPVRESAGEVEAQIAKPRPDVHSEE
ncbi:MAG: glycosyltransferase family 2 protein [Gemmataceae bacterium]